MLGHAAVARSLGPSDFGVLYFVSSVAGFAYVFVDWGHGAYVIRAVALGRARTGELIGTVMAVRAATAVVLTLPVVLMARLLGYDGRTQLAIATIMLAWLPMYLGLSYGWAFRGIERMEFDALIQVLQKLLTLVATVTILMIGGRILGVLAATGIAGSVMFVIATLIYLRLGLPNLTLRPKIARELVVGGVPIMTMTIAVALQPYIDANMLSRLSPPHVLGWYGAAVTFTNTLVAPALVLGSAVYPRLSVADADGREFGKILCEALRPLLFAIGLGAIGIWLFADPVVGVVYSARQYGPTAAILRSFTPAMVLVFLDMMLGTAILASGKALSLASAKILSVAVIAGLELFLIPLCQANYGNGGIGVMLSFAGGELVMVAAAIRLLPQGTLNRRIGLDIVRTFVAAGATWLVLRSLDGLSPLIGIVSCISLFSFFAYAVGLVSRTDLTIVAGLLPRNRRAFSEARSA